MWLLTMLIHTILFSVLHSTHLTGIGLRCDMIPEGVTAPKCAEEIDRYKIDISGNPDTYVPNEQYTGKKIRNINLILICPLESR